MSVAVQWARFRSADGRVGFGTLEAGELSEYTGDMFDAPQVTGRRLEPGSFALLAPCAPSKIIALWNNFRALAAKLDKPLPVHPLFLIKPASSVIGPQETIRRPAGYAGKIVYEGELGIVIGRRCKEVTVDEAAQCIFGYTCVNDVTAADVLNESPDFAQWTRAKGYDTFACLGPIIAAGVDVTHATIVTRVGDVERQNYPVADMILPPAQLVSLLSRDMTLLPGDVVACGTSLGVGSLRDGATVEVTIDGIGSLKNVLAP